MHSAATGPALAPLICYRHTSNIQQVAAELITWPPPPDCLTDTITVGGRMENNTSPPSSLLCFLHPLSSFSESVHFYFSSFFMSLSIMDEKGMDCEQMYWPADLLHKLLNRSRDLWFSVL